jgi:magnesium chelatase family protein
VLAASRERGLLSARGQHRALRVARTIADLERSERVKHEHLAGAFSLRPEAGLSGRRAA